MSFSEYPVETVWGVVKTLRLEFSRNFRTEFCQDFEAEIVTYDLKGLLLRKHLTLGSIVPDDDFSSHDNQL